jgi:hypothetical protein
MRDNEFNIIIKHDNGQKDKYSFNIDPRGKFYKGWGSNKTYKLNKREIAIINKADVFKAIREFIKSSDTYETLTIENIKIRKLG